MSENTQSPTIVLPDRMEGWVTCKEAAEVMGYKQEGYVRTLINKGRLHAAKVEVNGRKTWYIDPASIDHYQATKGTFAEPSDFARFALRLRRGAITQDEVAEAMVEHFGPQGEDWTLEKPSASRRKKAAQEPGQLIALVLEEVEVSED